MPTTESVEFLNQELEKIEKWEKDQKGLWFWEKIGRLPFALLDKLTPKFIQAKIGMAIDELGSYIQTGGQYLISEKAVFQKFNLENEIISLEQVGQLPLSQMDEVAEELKNSRTKFAAVQGATTGFGGIFTLAIDIPVLLSLSLKVLQEIALSYGYDPKEKAERIFIVKCLQFASSDVVGKKAILEDLTDFASEKKNQRMISQLQGWREVVITYRDNFGWKKLFQLVPIAGMIFGSIINKSSIADVAETGMMLYRKRRILERLQQMKKPGEV
ncbi:EcsC family protein [Neobacillus sp. OS1-32]|uniref:EcsC family protein n=1 Tax=Neobacillus sp. OS1-32 TaxID=3070682 RepID=UPI0027DED49F|nr:EcsC family protein [Neobacillus sp. OS1-32]WML31467.1 EcsC family protein [Neobacillus sp. OS1-32]